MEMLDFIETEPLGFADSRLILDLGSVVDEEDILDCTISRDLIEEDDGMLRISEGDLIVWDDFSGSHESILLKRKAVIEATTDELIIIRRAGYMEEDSISAMRYHDRTSRDRESFLDSREVGDRERVEGSHRNYELWIKGDESRNSIFWFSIQSAWVSWSQNVLIDSGKYEREFLQYGMISGWFAWGTMRNDTRSRPW